MLSNVTKLAKQEMALDFDVKSPLIAPTFNPNRKNLNQNGKVLNPNSKDHHHGTI